ncbi:MAG TPA: hypothetical protein VK735_14775 [Pseudonocardia sp.]|uniref:hypothetical protein n=1 Tax=Pseudonocardia sp. TaxID=60912 RepID=UPI002C9A6EA5|nr:hypothetical protein [Pseudonocardia sp.]HTF48708.1 hypothetical protein [Pseudonocardia sp.]
MDRIRAASRAALPLVAVLCALGMAGGPAWASTSVRPLQPEPASVYPAECADNGGHVYRDRDDPDEWHCEGGKHDGEDVRIEK